MKKNINITHRLKECSLMVDFGSKIVDVGTDHAYLPIYLANESKISHAIACDVRKGPLENAKSNIEKFHLENKIETRLSDGLENIDENEAEEIIIAGMGGILITKILENCKWKNKIGKKFILQPMKHERNLRIYLSKSGYKIENEKAIECMGKIYVIIKAVYTSVSYKINPEEEYIGNLNPNDEYSVIYIKNQIKDLKNRLKGSFFEKNKNLEEYYTTLIKKIEKRLENERSLEENG